MDIRDHGLRGKNDETIYEFAQENKAVVLTGDRDFGNIQRFPLGEHNGIVVTRFPNKMPTVMINQKLLGGLKCINEADYKGNVIIIDSLKIRIRRPGS